METNVPNVEDTEPVGEAEDPGGTESNIGSPETAKLLDSVEAGGGATIATKTAVIGDTQQQEINEREMLDRARIHI